ncbi:S24 family peptidase [Thiothrix litoralis]|jgi:SOS-response transcriptional repressor LexA|uniref:S24 family peptidase n=2 Tax=Thiothrix TaxID=1030 RepID=A0ABY9MQS9_9GAMM|nr:MULTISPECIES: S24 family peptidase [Thiothrix]QTR48170.1 S24 family peptidase [Thiothrix litoralis]WML90883.1 S24 family peptidase [Thiothrix lacustris]WMP17429.1 S24 family peptidase [Thiothrix lacustris]
MSETRINVETFKQNLHAVAQPDFKHNMGTEGSCSENEPYALQVIDDSMEPEFAKGCVIVIDPTGIVRDGAYVFAVDNKDEYIFRQLRIIEGKYILTALHEDYEAIEINGMKQIIGVITQRAGKRRSYHKWYDK